MGVQIDELQLYLRQPFQINDKIILQQPTIGEISKFGEQKYYSMVQTLVTISSDMKSVLHDAGIDYESISDFQLFSILSKNLTPDDTYPILGNVNLSDFEMVVKKENDGNDEVVLYNLKTDMVIDRLVHSSITKYVCKLHGIVPKIEKAANQFTKKVLIDEDRIKRQKEYIYHSSLTPLISSMVNSAEFKYNTKQVLDIGIYEFMDSVKRIGLIKSTDWLMQGIYAGSVDSSKISKSETDWTRAFK